MSSPEGQKIKRSKLEIESAINSLTDSGKKITSDQAKKIIDDIYYKEEREAAALEEEARLKKEAAEKKMTLQKCIKLYIEQIKSGARQTEQGRNYAPSTIRAIVTAINQWTAFQKHVHRVYDFDDIDMKCYYDYTTFLKNKTKVVDGKQVFDGYSINSIGKCVKELKAILYTAETEGYHHNNLWKDKKFKGTRIEVDNVYLTREELQRIMELKYDGVHCSSQLLEILRKYDFQMPHLEDQVINRYLKEICRDAGITEKVEIEVTNGGTPKKVWKEKCDPVHTHTARRTGATLMYLSGMDIYDIMKITGHTSTAMLRKYIKAENLTVVEKITDKYDYFD